MTNILHIYTRVSSLIQQEEGTSLDNQKQLGIKKAKELEYEFRLWNEGGQSSFHDDLNNRPVLVSLLTLIESGTVEHLFVYNTDRLSRNQQTWAVIRYKLITHGVTLHTASGQMKLQNPLDDLMLGILSEISQYDNRIRCERSRMGRFQKIQQGSWKGGPPPFGYRLNNRRLEVDPFESEWIKKIYDWYCHGVTVKEIQARLSRQGVMTRRGNQQWSLGSIQVILRNPVYVGYFDYTDKMIGETVRIDTPSIIDTHTYQYAQDKRKRTLDRKHMLNPSKHFYLLRDVLVCGHCGSPMGGRTNKAGHQHLYYCVKKERVWKTRDENHPKWKRGIDCSMVRSINIGKTNQLVWDAIKGVLQQIHDNPPQSSSSTQQDHHGFNDSDLVPSAEINLETKSLSDDRIRPSELTQSQQSNMILSGQSLSQASNLNPFNGVASIAENFSPEQIDLLSDQERKSVVNSLLSKVSVFFEEKTKKHRLDVEFSEEVSSLLESFSNDSEEITLKKSGGSAGGLTAEQDYMVTVE